MQDLLHDQFPAPNGIVLHDDDVDNANEGAPADDAANYDAANYNEADEPTEDGIDDKNGNENYGQRGRQTDRRR